jgi:glycosyltransferase involved in cell wall biosynthesis
MRILKISDVYFPRVNGVSTSIRTFSLELQRQGHEVTLIAPAYPERFDDEFEILRIPSRYIFVDPEDRLMRGGALRRRVDDLRRRNFDIIHVHTPFAAHYEGVWLGRQLGLPVVETYHTYFEEYLDKYLTWLPRKTLRYVARRFSRSQCEAGRCHCGADTAHARRAARLWHRCRRRRDTDRYTRGRLQRRRRPAVSQRTGHRPQPTAPAVRRARGP